ncbi:MAG: hypothetical protein CMP23_08270 [Rickettsiales bacterium]|nr:hypothetical protein [Rickettsiales bacterium]
MKLLLELRATVYIVFMGLLLVGADCQQGGPIAPARDFAVTLYDPGPYQQSYRSQPGPVYTWSGSDLAYVEMTAPVTITGELLNPFGGGLPGACVFLDGNGELADLSAVTDSQGQFVQTILPSRYQLALAPDCFTGSSPSMFLDEELLDGTDGLSWELAELATVAGRVSFSSGEAIEGAVVSVYPAGRPDRPLGIAVTTDSAGQFLFEIVPGQRYDIVVTGPADGSLPIAPIRVDNQLLPEVNGLSLEVQFPVLPTAQVLGKVQQASGTSATGRVRIEGWVSAATQGSQFSGGAFRAEFETDTDGLWQLELPQGNYRARAIPRHGDRGLGVADTSFEIDIDTDILELDLVLPGSEIARVEVLQPSGQPLVGARIELRMTSLPYYSYSETTGDDGAWVGLLIKDRYEIEIIAPEQTETGEQRFARTQTELDLVTSPMTPLSVTMSPSDLMDGYLYTVGQTGVRGAHILIKDPESGGIWDEAVTNDGEFPGFFRATLPR